MTSAGHAAVITRSFSNDEGGPADGGNLNARRLVGELASRGVTVDVFVREHRESPGCGVPANVQITEIPVRLSNEIDPMRRAFDEAKRFTELLARHARFWPHKYKAVYTHHWTSAVALDALLPKETHLVHTPHLLASEKITFMPGEHERRVIAAESRLLRRANCIVAVSPNEAQSIAKRVASGADKTLIAPNHIAPPFFETRRQRRRSTRLQLTSIGRVCRQKGTDILIEAARLLYEEGVEFDLKIVGGFYGEQDFESKLLEQIARHELGQRVRFEGPLPHRDLPALLAETDVYIQPSRYESQCVAALEALASGCIVVASDLPVTRHYIADGVVGFLVDRNPTALAAAIRSAASLGADATQQMRRRGRKAASAFAPADGLMAVADLCDQGAEGPGPGAASHHQNAAHGETLFVAAEQLAVQLAAIDGVSAVVLTGSVARGNADAASDVDLLVITEHPLDHPLLAVWRVEGSVMWNVHQVGKDHLRDVADGIAKGIDGDDLHTLSIAADELHNARVLQAPRRAKVEGMLRRIGSLRSEPELVVAIGTSWLSWSKEQAIAAIEAVRNGAAEDAQFLLQRSALALLTGRLVLRGWVQHGAKKRPEIASTFLPDPGVELALGFLFEASGLEGATPPCVNKISDLRHQFRSLYVSEISVIAASLAGPSRAMLEGYCDRLKQHETGSMDYYKPLIARGFYRGALNHIRLYSGLGYVASDLSKAFGYDGDYPRTWLRSRQILAPTTYAVLAELLGPPASSDKQMRLAQRLLSS